MNSVSQERLTYVEFYATLIAPSGQQARNSRVEPFALDKWPLPRPKLWLRENRPQKEAELASIRRSVDRGQPQGSDQWVRATAQRLGLEWIYIAPPNHQLKLVSNGEPAKAGRRQLATSNRWPPDP